MNYNSASLYVGDLHPEINESVLYEIFHEVGPIISIRVCKDNITRKSLGYAYVNFQNPQDAERALDTLNYTDVKDRPIRIMWSQRDPSIRKSGIGNIFIKNMDKSIDNKALYDTFSAFGNILSCKVCQVTRKDERGEPVVESAGYGFVHFETQEAAEKAIAKVNGMLLNGKQVFVGPFVKKSERLKILSNEDSFTNVFVKNLDASVDDNELKDLFSKFGEIQSAVVMKDNNGKSKQFGFINFVDHAAAVIAVDELNEKEYKGKKLFVGRAQKKSERRPKLKEHFQKLKQEWVNKYKGLNLYVKNLDDSVDDARLRQEFSKFGEIYSATVMVDEKTKQSKNFGFVCFTTPEAANKALTEMNGHMMGSKPLYVNFAQPKELRKAQLEAQHNARKQQHMVGPHMFPPQVAPQVFFQQGTNPPFVTGIKPRWQPGRGVPTNMPPTGLPSHGRGNNVMRGGNTQRGRGVHNAPPKNQGNRNTGYKITNNARNRPVDQPPQMQQNTQLPPQPTHTPTDTLSPEYLANLPEQDQKNILGERLFPLVHLREPKNAPKITGMLLDMDVSDILHLIESTEALYQKIKEAVAVLEEHGQTNGNDQ
ncbi:hypothetical protein ABK040_002126 [Willaertia magna]